MNKWIGMVSVFGWAIFLSASSHAHAPCGPAGKKAEAQEAVRGTAPKADCAAAKAVCEGEKKECGAVGTVGKPQTLCPVMAAPINRKLYVDHGGKRIYVCRPGCVEVVTQNPADTIAKLKAQGIAFERVKTKADCAAKKDCGAAGK